MNCKIKFGKEYKQKYYADNKEKWNIYVSCKCGGKYCHNTRTNHFKTKKHVLFYKDNQIKILEEKIKSLENKI